MKPAICEQFCIDFPLFAFSHCRDVVAAVTNAGGFGVLGATAFTPQHLDQKLSFSIAMPDAAMDTTCTVSLGPATGQTRRLLFTHTGWARLGLPSERGRALRRRFAALDQAKNLASVTSE